MLKNLPVDALKIGMYVILPLAWYQHSFLKNAFLLVSEKQIIKIRSTGLQEITIDTEKGIDVPDEPPVTDAQVHASVKTKNDIIPSALREALFDKNLQALAKATIIHEQSREMMRRLLDNPSADNIKTVKQGISEVVNLIMTDDATSHHLLLITSHDFYTFTHSVTVGILGVSLSKLLFRKSDRHNMQELGAGFFLHDLGKVGIRQDILKKAGRLTPEEWAEIRQHPIFGFNILNETKQLTEECKLIVLQHHEREDGKGYPKGLQGDSIHTYGRICAIADVYDALTSERPYREKLTPFAALKLMRDEMMSHFHRELFEKFVKLFMKTA